MLSRDYLLLINTKILCVIKSALINSLKHDVSLNQLLKGRKHFRKENYGFCHSLVKRIVFTQPESIVKGTYYCDDYIKVVIYMSTLWQQFHIPAEWCAVAQNETCRKMFLTSELAPNSPDLYPVLFNLWCSFISWHIRRRSQTLTISGRY